MLRKPQPAPLSAGPVEVAGGDVVAAFLERAGVRDAFGVISIHNIPIFDGLARYTSIRCVGSRGEAGCVNMADGYARSTGSLGVALTSTGTGAGNAAGALIEALGAGTPLLHITGQVATDALGRMDGYIHETRDQLGLLRSVSKDAFRVTSPEALLPTLKAAYARALTPPCGPVSVEIPIDIQQARVAMPSAADLAPPEPLAAPADRNALAGIAQSLSTARRPLLWLGGGARNARDIARRFADAGWAIATSLNGRAIVPEDHPSTLGVFATFDAAREFIRTCDAVVVAGSRLRGTDTLEWKLALPAACYRIDIDADARNRAYPATIVPGDAAASLAALYELVHPVQHIAPGFAAGIASTRRAVLADLDLKLGDYAGLARALAAWMPRGAIWARDISIANSVWANRFPPLASPRSNVHAAGGGIGQGLPMAIGAAVGNPDRKTVALAGDGGLMLNLGELATLVQERADVLLIVMNNNGYGMIRHIQHTRYGARYQLDELHTPDFQQLALALGLPSVVVRDAASFASALEDFGALRGPALIEVDMHAIGRFGGIFNTSQK